jgi:hypothetical protein
MSAVTGSNIFAPSTINTGSGGTIAANLNGLFKETYESKLKDLIPDGVKLLNSIKFMEKSKQPGKLKLV